jgi:hypothetical protein
VLLSYWRISSFRPVVHLLISDYSSFITNPRDLAATNEVVAPSDGNLEQNVFSGAFSTGDLNEVSYADPTDPSSLFLFVLDRNGDGDGDGDGDGMPLILVDPNNQGCAFESINHWIHPLELFALLSNP